MKLLILTLAAATLVLGAPLFPSAPVAYETSGPRLPQSEVSKHQIESMIEESFDYHELRSLKRPTKNKRAVEEDLVAGLFFLLVKHFYVYFIDSMPAERDEKKKNPFEVQERRFQPQPMKQEVIPL